MKYEWDEVKRQTNRRKHAIDFADLPDLFEGYTATVEDARFSYNESCFITIGLLKGRAIVVAHAEREEKIRFISARKANKNEEIGYFRQITKRLGAARYSRRRKR
ncbi:MAG: BrnT family toxin [Chloroflexi bacterium]|nr:BrnT family toxin [Chloroflexota bacterium]